MPLLCISSLLVIFYSGNYESNGCLRTLHMIDIVVIVSLVAETLG